MGEYEYKYNYLDWYLQIQIHKRILSQMKIKKNVYGYKSYKVCKIRHIYDIL